MQLPDLWDQLVNYLRIYNVEVSEDLGVSRGEIFALARWMSRNPPEDVAYEFEAELEAGQEDAAAGR